MEYLKQVYLILTIIILLSNILPFLFNSQHDISQTSPDSNDLIEKEIEDGLLEINRGSRGPTGLIENNSHGGSWIDEFNNSDGIEKMSNLELDITALNRNLDVKNLRLTNISSKFYTIGYLQSKSITIQKGMQWDSLIINKMEPSNCWINISILNASNNQLIYGPISSSDEINIRNKIDSILYLSIKLNATFISNGTVTPILHHWGISWNVSNAWRDSFFSGLKAVKENLTNCKGELWLKTYKNKWYKYNYNPVVQNGTSTTWDDEGVRRPTIVFNGTGYMLWYEGVPGSSDADKQVGLTISSDGLSWTKYSNNPVLPKGTSGTWDDYCTGNPSVLFDGNIYKMWYQGRRSGTRWEIGYATSKDGYSWQKYANNPVLKLGSGGAWDANNVGDPYVYFDGLLYRMWYAGVNSLNKKQLGYATSYDGINWTKYQNNPVLAYSGNNNVGDIGVFVEDNQYSSWYSHISTSTEIDHANSIDGINWIIYPSNPVINKGSSGAWDSKSAAAPDIILRDKQYNIYYHGVNSVTSIQQIGLAKSKFRKNENITSKPIIIPNQCCYNKLIITKQEIKNTSIKVTLIDNKTGKGIKNFENISDSIIDISKISPFDHSSIILKANFNSNEFSTPVLFDWSINWTKNYKPKILNVSTINQINRTFSRKISINLSDIEEPEENLTLQVKYRAPSDLTWHTKYLSSPTYESDHWECIFIPDAQAELGLYDFYIKCNESFQLMDTLTKLQFIEVINNNPIIWNISSNLSGNHVKRTKSIKFYINTSDIETPANFLDIEIKYKSPQNIEWQYEHISDVLYLNDHWEVEFNPTSKHSLGEYIFNVTCMDNETEVFDYTKIWVQNNAPVTLEITILPSEPRTRDDLSIRVLNAFDIETSFNKLKFWYRWYKDNYYMKDFDNSTIIPATETMKDQIWRCVVFPHDGIDLGTPAETEIKILNSPPELIEEFNTFDMSEDQPVIINEKLNTIFTDADNDTLKFSISGQDNLEVEIIQDNGTVKISSSQNWFGIEIITFYANDTFSSAAQESVIITVNPTNDLPWISQIGNQYISDSSKEYQFIGKQDNWLNLTIIVEDIDGDVDRGKIQYILNITQTTDFYFREHDNSLIFHPKNQDVGWHYINISVTDNNETPTQYVWQHIKIRVININDSPTVKITFPEDNKEFLETDKISFSCIAEDIDLLVWNSQEELTYRWFTNRTILRDFGTENFLSNITFTVGFYNVTIEVEDTAGAKAYDHVNIRVKELPEQKREPTITTSIYLWLGILIVIILIVIIAVILLITRKKEKRKEPEGISQPQALQPDSAYLPKAPTLAPTAQLSQQEVVRAESMPGVTTQELLESTSVTTTLTQPTAQLPPPQPPISVSPASINEEQIAGIDTELSLQQKMALLEKRLLQGEISEETYLNLKDKYEIVSKQYRPPPQLPPPSITSSQSTQPPQQQPSEQLQIHPQQPSQKLNINHEKDSENQ